MQDKEVFDLAGKYRQENPEIEHILQIFESAEQYLIQLEQLEQWEQPVITINSSTTGGSYEPPTITAPFITATGSTGTVEFPAREP